MMKLNLKDSSDSGAVHQSKLVQLIKFRTELKMLTTLFLHCGIDLLEITTHTKVSLHLNTIKYSAISYAPNTA
jgi:hypothetical protein